MHYNEQKIMYYIIQEKLFKEENYDNLIRTIEKFDLSYEIVTLLPFVEDFDFKTDRKDVFPFGAVKMSRISKKYGWYPGSTLCENHDYEVYSRHYKDNLLNYDSGIINFGDENFFHKEIFFARPTLDTKVFTGRVFDMEQWENFRYEQLTNGHSTILDKNTKIQISSVKKIQKEIRFWIVKGQIVTASQYMLGNRYCLDDIVDEPAYDFVNKMINLFEINETFVMDVCLVDGNYKIVECGCTNSAGFYKADMQKLIMSLETSFS